uniref:Microprocessor complex subunit DGCR8 n=1 Tax=Gongylonema pulchrum TaxID=637853 RepID=A0A183E9G2_9BILA
LLEKPVEEANVGSVILPEGGEKRQKRVLKHRVTTPFECLPEGWVEVTHCSGLPVYVERKSRVCTFSRPYCIGRGSARNHAVPVSAIPCLHQKRVRKEMEEAAAAQADRVKNAAEGGANSAEDIIARIHAPPVKVQSVQDYKKEQLDGDALYEYAKNNFQFTYVPTVRFNKWSATRDFHRQRKLAQAERMGKTSAAIEVSLDRPSLSSNVKLITVPSMEANQKPQHRSFFLNPQGKTSVSVLHEYVQKVLKSTINYVFSETRNSAMPFVCSARLKINQNNRVLYASSVREKLMLLQEKQMREQRLRENGEEPNEGALKVTSLNQNDGAEDEEQKAEDDSVELFDMIEIEDSRVYEISARAGQPSPYLLLQECLKQNAAFGDTEIKLHSSRVKHQRHQFDMEVGKHRVSVICTNKREGKQKTSQAMLKKLHPNLNTWGSLLRLYGHETQQKQQEARKSRHSIIKLQGAYFLTFFSLFFQINPFCRCQCSGQRSYPSISCC